jgi:predicted nucleic acid-binding protein
MKAYLVDTNVLLRAIQRDNIKFRNLARAAIKTLYRRGNSLCVCAQNLIELWNVSTRALNANGLGLSLAETQKNTARCEAFFRLLPESPDIFQEWKRLVTAHQVAGLKVHDARLVAAMNVYRIPSIVTFDVGDFRRYDIEVVHPESTL